MKNGRFFVVVNKKYINFFPLFSKLVVISKSVLGEPVRRTQKN